MIGWVGSLQLTALPVTTISRHRIEMTSFLFCDQGKRIQLLSFNAIEVGKLYEIIILVAVAMSHGYEACNLKESNKTFVYTGVKWACKKYCPKLRGCLKECCRKFFHFFQSFALS